MPELAIYSSIGVRSAADELFQKFEKTSGHKLAVTWGTAPMLVKRIEGGETRGCVDLQPCRYRSLRKQGKIAPGSDVTLAGSGVAIAVKAGAPKPDISTPEALKQTLLKAKSIAYSEPSAGGASGVYFAKLLERMGIADQMQAKTKYPPAGGFSAELLLTGEAELAVQQKPELAARRRHRDRRLSARRSEHGHGIRRRHHAGQQERRRGKRVDRGVALARRKSGVPRQGSRSELKGALRFKRAARRRAA